MQLAENEIYYQAAVSTQCISGSWTDTRITGSEWSKWKETHIHVGNAVWNNSILHQKWLSITSTFSGKDIGRDSRVTGVSHISG